MALPKRPEPIVNLACGECGSLYQLTRHRARVHQRQGTVPRCERCRLGSLAVLSDEERAAYRDWWLHASGIPERELSEIARGLVPG